VPLGVRPPALDLKDEQGQPFSLENLRGVPAVLILFRGAT
jgi:peroxiredoxin